MARAGGGVVDPYAWDHHGDAGLPRCTGVAVGHIGCGLLMAGGEHIQAGFVSHTGHQAVKLDARDAKNGRQLPPVPGILQGASPPLIFIWSTHRAFC